MSYVPPSPSPTPSEEEKFESTIAEVAWPEVAPLVVDSDPGLSSDDLLPECSPYQSPARARVPDPLRSDLEVLGDIWSDNSDDLLDIRTSTPAPEIVDISSTGN